MNKIRICIAHRNHVTSVRNGWKRSEGEPCFRVHYQEEKIAYSDVPIEWLSTNEQNAIQRACQTDGREYSTNYYRDDDELFYEWVLDLLVGGAEMVEPGETNAYFIPTIKAYTVDNCSYRDLVIAYRAADTIGLDLLTELKDAIQVLVKFKIDPKHIRSSLHRKKHAAVQR